MPHAPSARPKLRPCEPRPLDGPRADGLAVALRDVLGIAPEMVALSAAAYTAATHFDGRNTLRDLGARFGGGDAEVEAFCRLADALDRAGFLEGTAFEAMKAEALGRYRAKPVREAACAGGSYPDEPGALRAFLDAFFAHAQGPGDRGVEGAGPAVRGLVAPHIDLHRGGPCYAHAYRALRQGRDADLFVVFGTAHATPPHLFTLTGKSYDTPLGPIPTDAAVFDALVAELGEDEVLADELVHRQEHACEFQMVWLQHLFGHRPITALPVLCSSIDHLARPEASVRSFIEALRRAVAGRKVCFIAGADLAHVGVLYGDPRGPTPEELTGFADDDLRTLEHFCHADAHAFAIDARRNGAARRLCGTAPMFAVRMSLPDAKGDLLRHQQWTDGTDSVSFCAVRLA